MTLTLLHRDAHAQGRPTVLVQGADGLRVVPFRRRDVLLARLHAGALDRQLAAGADPESSYALAVRTAVLTSRRHRERLAGCWIHALERAERPSRPGDPHAPVNPVELHRAQEEIARLVAVLRAPQPVAVGGVAMAQGLLTAATSPVYAVRGGTTDALAAALNRTLTAL